MKVDPHLILVKGVTAADGQGQGQPSPAPQRNREGVLLLIFRENQRAWRLSPTSLGEAKELLEKVQGELGVGRGEALSEVHRLEAGCLVRLR